MGTIYLKSISGPLDGQSFEFTDKVIIGRNSDCNLQIEEPSCSRQHALIEYLNNTYYIKDLGSRNGIVLNGNVIKNVKIELKFGDKFSLGRSKFLFLSHNNLSTKSEFSDLLAVESLDINQVEENVTRQISEQFTVDLNELFQSSRPKEFNQSFLYQVSKDLNGLLDSEAIIKTLSQSVFNRHLNLEVVSMFLVKEIRGTPRIVKKPAHSRASRKYDLNYDVIDKVKVERKAIRCLDSVSVIDQTGIRFQEIHSFHCIPLIARNELLGILYLEGQKNSLSKEEFELITVICSHGASSLAASQMYEQSQNSYLETILALGKAIEAKDAYTRGHSERVANYSVEIGKKLGFDQNRLGHLRVAAELHDIGKIAIDDAVIGKNDRLTKEEFELIKKHPELGVDILKPIQSLRPILPFVLYHHERFNGRGYPEGLKGEEIPLEARIINVADAFDAMTTQRSYNIPMSEEDALKRCISEAGRSFDYNCVMALVESFGKGFLFTEVHCEENFSE